MRYFYNSWDSAYKSHFGAIARNQSCQFTIRLPEETPLDFLRCWWFSAPASRNVFCR